MRWKRPIFALVTLISFFAILELALWLAGVPTLLSERDPFQGFSDRVRVFELDAKRGVYRTPPRATLHSFNYEEFPARKPRDGFRLFVLGGSSAYGFPWGAQRAFPRMLGDALRASWPDRPIETINAAAMSYGSHRLRILARELLDYSPDALVIYSGHNEFIEQRFYDELLRRPGPLDPLRRRLYRWRLYSLLARSLEQRAGAGSVAHDDPREHDAAALLGLDVQREYPREVVDADKDVARARFEENLRAIVSMARSAGVPVILCTVPSNVSRWRPNHSTFDSVLEATARSEVLRLLDEAVAALDGERPAVASVALEEARRRAPGHAEVLFRLGQAYERLGRLDEAREAYLAARDADARPSRAIDSLNRTLRRIGAEPGVVLVDVEQAFEQAAAGGLPGFDLFEDYVHPNPEGHRLIALRLWQALLEQGLLGAPRPAEVAAFDAAVAPESSATSDEDSRTPALLFNLAVVLENQGRTAEAMANYRACLELHPGYYVARANLARLLSREGRDSEAAAEHRAVLEVEPAYVRSMLGLGESLRRMGRLDEALEMFRRAQGVDPGSASAWRLEGATLVQLQRLPQAETALRRAAQIDPDDVETAVDLGYCLLYQAKSEEARATFGRALEASPGHGRARNGLAAALTDQGRLDEAERLFRESLRLDPADGFATVGLEEIGKRRKAGNPPS